MAYIDVNTKILLRNDQLSNWADSSLVLGQGEVALACRPDGSYEMRVGNGTQSWNQLGEQNFKLSAGQVIGLQEEISHLSTAHYEVSSLDQLSASSYNNGDTAVVIVDIASGKKSYTAYVYDSQLTAWKAMDGNYSAENVYFEDDITCAGSYSQVGNVTKTTTGTTTLPASGKSLKEVMQTIFTKELNPSASLPAVSLATSDCNGEVGSSYNVPAATLKVTGVGSYTYGPSTGIAFPASQTSVSCTTEGTSAKNATALYLNGTVTLSAGASKKFIDGTTSYSYSASARHTDGAIPVTNLGNAYPSAKIASATLSKTTIAKCTGWRKMFIGSLAVDAPVTEATVKALSYQAKSAAAVVTVQASGAPAEGASAGTPLVPNAVKIIVALPPGRSLSIVNLVSASNTPITSDYVSKGTVQVSGATAGENKTAYAVYVYQPASIDPGEVHNITIA